MLDSVGNKIVNEGSALGFTASATDVEDDVLTYSLANGITACGTVTSCTVPAERRSTVERAFSWTPPRQRDLPNQGCSHGRRNSTLSDSEEITVTVSNVAPTVTDPTLTVNNVSGDITATLKYSDPGTADTQNGTFEYRLDGSWLTPATPDRTHPPRRPRWSWIRTTLGLAATPSR